jgi:hypothetical protein
MKKNLLIGLVVALAVSVIGNAYWHTTKSARQAADLGELRMQVAAAYAPADLTPW